MTSFGWKRKAGESISKDISLKFSAESENEDFPKSIQWVSSFKRKKTTLQENCKLKYEEFKAEGIRLAELQRFEEAVIEWDKALSLVPSDDRILEMKAQALLQLNCPFPALQSAERAVKVNPRWWVAYQTLGRSQLGIGDLIMAKRSFCKAIHLNPLEKELWDEDLKWTLSLIKRKEKMENENGTSVKKTSEISEIVYDEEGYIISSGDTTKFDGKLVKCKF